MQTASITLITGGVRSGKSRHALTLAEACGARRLYLATAEPIDDEMRARIARHQQERAERGWSTIEAPLALAEALRSAPACDVALIDCLTIWTSNLMWRAEQQSCAFGEDEARVAALELIAACRDFARPVILVTNEVGFGGVAADAVARRYADVLGRVNQTIAEAAERVTMLVCGQPLILKGK